MHEWHCILMDRYNNEVHRLLVTPTITTAEIIVWNDSYYAHAGMNAEAKLIYFIESRIVVL